MVQAKWRSYVENLLDKVLLFKENVSVLAEGFPSGQRDQTVNLTALPSEVRILPPPPSSYADQRSHRYAIAGVVQW